MGGSVYQMLFGNSNQGNAFDYFLKSQEAQQNYNFNQQVMQQRAQQMQFAQQLQPLELAKAQAGIDLVGQQTKTSAEQLAGLAQDRQFQAQMQPLNMQQAELMNQQRSGQIEAQQFDLSNAQQNAPLERQIKQQQLQRGELGMTADRQTIASNQFKLDQARADQKANAYLRLGSLASSAKEMGAEGSQERMDFIKTVMPQIKKLGLDDELDFEAIASDGVSDAELDQVIGLANSLRGPQSGMQLLKMQEQLLKNQKAGIDVQNAVQTDAKNKRESLASANSAKANIDNFLTSLDRIIATPQDVMDDAMGPVSTRLPTFSQDTANFEELMNGVDAQAFVSQIANAPPGALSEAEGKKLGAALQNFSLRQDPKMLKQNAKEAQRLLLKARSNLDTKFGTESTVPDTPTAKATPEDFDAIMKGYGF